MATAAASHRRHHHQQHQQQVALDRLYKKIKAIQIDMHYNVKEENEEN